MLTLLFILWSWGAGAASSQSPVYVLNQHSQLVTSSTLKWVTASDGARPSGSVKGGQNLTSEFFACRAAQRGGGQFHAGHLDGRACRVLVGEQEVLAFSKYQVLVNVDGAARLEWAPWHQFKPLPPGAVSVDEGVVAARAWVPTSSSAAEQGGNGTALVLTPGGLYTERQYGLIMIAVQGGTHGQQRHTKGQVLVEHEPIRYDLSDFFRGRQTSESQRDISVPGNRIHIDGGEGDDGRVFNVSFVRRWYFGRGHSIPTGVVVSVRFRHRAPMDLTWGVETGEPVSRQLRIGYSVPTGHRVDVSLSAREIKRKFEFSATLVTHFDDGAIIMRPIKGRYQEVTLDRFAPVFGTPVPLWQLPTTTSATTTAVSAPPRTRPPKLKRAHAAGADPALTAASSSAAGKTRAGSNSMVKSYRYPLDDDDDEKGRSKQGTGKVSSYSSSSDKIGAAKTAGLLLTLVTFSAAAAGTSR